MMPGHSTTWATKHSSPQANPDGMENRIIVVPSIAHRVALHEGRRERRGYRQRSRRKSGKEIGLLVHGERLYRDGQCETVPGYLARDVSLLVFRPLSLPPS